MKAATFDEFFAERKRQAAPLLARLNNQKALLKKLQAEHGEELAKRKAEEEAKRKAWLKAREDYNDEAYEIRAFFLTDPEDEHAERDYSYYYGDRELCTNIRPEIRKAVSKFVRVSKMKDVDFASYVDKLIRHAISKDEKASAARERLVAANSDYRDACAHTEELEDDIDEFKNTISHLEWRVDDLLRKAEAKRLWDNVQENKAKLTQKEKDEVEVDTFFHNDDLVPAVIEAAKDLLNEDVRQEVLR